MGFFRRNGLSISLLSLFLICQIGLSVVGVFQYNEQRKDHDQPQVTYLEYLATGSFLEATMENWESEFLQMFAYVVMTVFLFQQGSSESKKLDGDNEVDRDPRLSRNDPKAPWPVRKGGWILKLYENSLSLTLLALFFLSFALHAVGGAREYSLEEIAHGGQPVGAVEYLATSQFWFESLQNWQSEFLSIGLMVVLSIYLRQRGSPESKPVDAPHYQTAD